MTYHFLQGKKDLLEAAEHGKMLDIIKEKVASFFDMKNLCFLFGSGTSAKAIPLMSGLYEGLKDEKKSYSDKERAFLDGIHDDGNIENVLGALYSGRSFFSDRDNNTNAEQLQLTLINGLIDKIETFMKGKLDVLNDDVWNEEVKNTLSTYKQFYSKKALLNKELSRVNVFTTNNDGGRTYSIVS